MKGLIRNNFYSVGSTLTWTVAFCIFMSIAAVLGAVKLPSIGEALPILMLAQIGVFTGMTATALQKDNTSKWSKFERTLPIKISDVIKARYISFLMFSMIGILLASVAVMLFAVVLGQPLNAEKVEFGYCFGIVFALLVPSFLYPLVLKFGADKSELMLMIAVLITIVLFLGGGAILTPFLKNSNHADVIYRMICIIISVVVFISSYFVSMGIYKRKEF
ncbi:MAG: ABC-2 transporter permease [bacterium]|nr:ABC-2 transporter permease [bacterium]